MIGPQRIVCLTAETTEVLYLLGEQQRIVGISGYTTRPAIARKEKPRVSAFTSANMRKILELKPDLVLTCTDLQADIAAALIREGVEIHAFNQRSITEMLRMITTLGALVGSADKAFALVAKLQNVISVAEDTASHRSAKPRIYFEEWDDPLITGIRWVSELIDIAGGVDCFAELSHFTSAKHRIVRDPGQVVARQPDIIIGSWCGKKFQATQLSDRPGWDNIPAVRNRHVYEIKSADILQSGPSIVTHGLPQLQKIIQQWAASQGCN